MRTVLPTLLVAGAMYAVVQLTALAVPGNALLRLLAEVAAGVGSYVLLSASQENYFYKGDNKGDDKESYPDVI